MQTANRAKDLLESWGWLFPVTYLAHIAEEYWGGEGFPAWFSRIMKIELTPAEFIELNLIGLLLMILGTILAYKIRSMRWVLVSFGVVVLVNALLHLITSLVTASYSPGLFTGLLLWGPLGTVTLLRLNKSLSRRTFWSGVAVGIAIHTVVTLLALSGDRIY